MRCPAKRKITEIRQCFARTAFVDLSDAEQATQGGGDLKIDQLGRGQFLTSQPGSCRVSPDPIIDEDREEHTGVSDYHDQPG